MKEFLHTHSSAPNFDPIPPALLRKYISYARHYCHPKMSAEAAAIIQKFYLELRKTHQHVDSTPVTTRQLEAMIRLVEARAKIELRDHVTADDAHDVVEIVRDSLFATLEQVDLAGIHMGGRAQGSSRHWSKQKKAQAFIAALKRHADLTGQTQFSLKAMENIAIQKLQWHDTDIRELVDHLNHQNYLIRRGVQKYELF
eukprot:CAMPEP_0201547038 /NCGR_PEP_ID=MMETSP0173_2-20130828/3443_1 /ASSEMBLY_ACC=CAM_ASM_000268 /TAXON_ID=218659 /ORGANISM="Vexillifera sp., Strain DIVA3 564/2" /LENGTH=198 /DNA_ID=CAMNT_0047955937 /DNA_START=39 /DNA_END=632 /DNA_ORIENTATION=-